MSLYYDGDLDKDLKELKEEYSNFEIESLTNIGKHIGYGEAQRILQILWAKALKERGYSTEGALFR